MATLAQLRDRAKVRADMRGSGFLSDAEWDALLNSSADELYELLVTRYEDEFYAEAEFVTGDNGSTLPAPLPATLSYLYEEEVPLPGDFFKLLGVDLIESDTRVPLRPYALRERTALRNMKEAQQACQVRYRLQGQALRLLPRPPPGLVGTLLYVPRRAPLAADTDVLDGVLGWEEYVVVDAAARALMAEESDATPLLAERERLRQRITAAASQRSPGMPSRVVDVYGSDGEDW